MSGVEDTLDIKHVIDGNFDETNYTKGMIEFSVDVKASQCYYGFIITDVTDDMIGSNKGYDNKIGDAFSGRIYKVECIGETPTEVRNLLAALVKISDVFTGNADYNHMYVDNLNNVVWDAWNEDFAHKANRRKADIIVRMSRNAIVNYTV